MNLKFNIDRPKISDEEINKHKDFDKLLRQFKEESLKKARADLGKQRKKMLKYSAIIAGVAVVCTVSWLTINNQKSNAKHETLITQKKNNPVEPLTRKSFVKAPSSKLVIPYSSYTVNSVTGGEILHKASKIKIPVNAFVDKNGVRVTGEVKIEYREFHKPAEIIASGIPMLYDSAGHKRVLESAGMFDIKGTQNGQPVFIKEGAQVEVQMGSQVGDDRFNQYYLDTVSGNWSYLKRDDLPRQALKKSATENRSAKQITNSSLEQLKSEIEVILPKRIDSVTVVYRKKTQALPKPHAPVKPTGATGRPTFYIDGSKEEFPELAAFKKVIFEVGDENSNYNQSIHTTTWSDLKLSEGPKKGTNYLLTLSLGSRVEKLIVYPVLTGNDLEKAQQSYKQKFEEYNTLSEKRAEAERNLKAELQKKEAAYLAQMKIKQDQYNREKIAYEEKIRMEQSRQLARDFDKLNAETKVVRIFNLNRFGIFNSDCPHNLPAQDLSNPKFILEENQKIITPELVYIINHSLNVINTYNSSQIKTIAIDESAMNSLVVFSRNRIYHCSIDAFRKKQKEKTFNLTEMPEDTDLEKFSKALQI